VPSQHVSVLVVLRPTAVIPVTRLRRPRPLIGGSTISQPITDRPNQVKGDDEIPSRRELDPGLTSRKGQGRDIRRP